MKTSSSIIGFNTDSTKASPVTLVFSGTKYIHVCPLWEHPTANITVRGNPVAEVATGGFGLLSLTVFGHR